MNLQVGGVYVRCPVGWHPTTRFLFSNFDFFLCLFGLMVAGFYFQNPVWCWYSIWTVENISAICCNAVQSIFNQYIQSFVLRSMNKCKTMLALTVTLTSFQVHHVEWGFFFWNRTGSKLETPCSLFALCTESIRNEVNISQRKKCSNELLILLNFAHSQLLLKLNWQSHCRHITTLPWLRRRCGLPSCSFWPCLVHIKQPAKESNTSSAAFGKGTYENKVMKWYHSSSSCPGRQGDSITVSLTFCMEGRPPGQALCSANVSPVSARASAHPNIDLRALHQPHWRFPKAHPFTSSYF